MLSTTRRSARAAFILGGSLVALAVGFCLSCPAESRAAGKIISWEPHRVEASVPSGTAKETLVTSTIHQDIPASSVEIVPELAPFVSVEPSELPPTLADSQQTFLLTFQIPIGTTPSVLEGTLHIREGSRTLASPLPIALTITEESEVLSAKGLEIILPASWYLDEPSLDIGGPISLNNFGGAYRQGGLRPLGGAEIDITTNQLPSLSISEIIERDLQGTTIESTESIQVGGETGAAVVYSFELLPSMQEQNIAAYVPHNQLLYKFFLSYQSGDPREAQFLDSFHELLESVRFTE